MAEGTDEFLREIDELLGDEGGGGEEVEGEGELKSEAAAETPDTP